MSNIKSKIKQNIFKNLGSVISATIFVPVALLLSFNIQFYNIYDSSGVSFNLNSFSFISEIIFFTIVFLGIDLLRHNKGYNELSFHDNFTWLKTVRDWVDIFILNFIMVLFIGLWSMLFVIPGIYKAYAYSQAAYIFFDYKRAGNPIGYLDAITKSRQLMKGKKLDLFSLYLSFFGWIFLALICFFLAGLFVWLGVFTSFIFLFCGFAILWFVVVYSSFTLAHFYQNLIN